MDDCIERHDGSDYDERIMALGGRCDYHVGVMVSLGANIAGSGDFRRAGNAIFARVDGLS